MRTMSLSVARRTALAAQGFAEPRPSSAPTRRQLQRVLSRTKLLQLDSVNVAMRAHYAPLLSRLGPYDPALVDDAAWRDTARKPRLLVEAWAHEASLIPVQDWPLLMSGAKRPGWWRGYEPHADASPGLVDDVLAVVKERGPVGAGTIEKELTGGERRTPGSWWERSEVKKICEWLFGTGELTTGTRRGFERCYELTERVVPADVRQRRVDPADAARELIERSADALGVATDTDLRDYYRLGPATARTAVAEAVEAGTLEPVRVEGWRQQAYRHAAATAPRSVTGSALLCPFDPLIWERNRTERLFGFRYRIEIYVPAARREYGYYVFPFLCDGRLVGRVDLKADRSASVLRVPGAFAEPGVDQGRVAAELAVRLRETAGWLELDGVEVGERGDLVPALRRALSPRR
nr:crosslink repair DNA glycosylase YcaQ family protein [Prauserella halophila]